MKAKAKKDNIPWIMRPAINCVTWIAESKIQCIVIRNSIINQTGMITYLNIAREKILSSGLKTEQIDHLIKENIVLEKKSKEISDGNFHSVFSHSLVDLWSGIETAIEDTIVAILLNDKKSISILSLDGYRFKKDYAFPLPEDAARTVFKKLEGQSRNKFLGAGKSYCSLLNTLGVDVKLSESEQICFDEINEVRNCIMHRGGVIDNQATKKSPELSKYINQKFEINQKVFDRYYKFISIFAKKLLDASVKSRHYESFLKNFASTDE
jgi:hypothetical protein